MSLFLVSDFEPTIDQKEGLEVEADSAEEAAEKYAYEDQDGETDGVYAGGGHDVFVLDDQGTKTKFRVFADYDVTFSAWEVK